MSKPQFAILRFAKYKGPEISNIEAHNERTKEDYASNPDIDKSRSHLNFHLVTPQRKYRAESEKQIAEAGCRTRSDSVRVVEALVTASPEFFKGKKKAEIKAYFQEALGFIREHQDPKTIMKVIPEENKIIGYSTKNSGGVPENFKNYFVIQFDKPFTFVSTVFENNILPNETEAKGNHTGAVIGFATKKGEIVHARVASSFISPEQAELNLKELGKNSFDQLVANGREIWNREMSKIEIEDDNIDNLRTFYSCLYRSMLFPRSFYEIDAKGQVMHYSPYNGEVRPGYMFTDTGFWDTQNL